MSLNGSGVYVVNSAGQPVVASTLIQASVFNAFTADIATALSTAIFKDGQQTVTANIPMAGFRFTGLGAGTAAGHSVRWEQVIGLMDAAGDFLVGSAADTLVRASMPPMPLNFSFTLTVGASALTIALKDQLGADPSAASPVLVPFRNVTAATGDYTWLAVTAATSLVVSSGSTLGTRDTIPFRIWIVAFNDGGTFRLGVVNCVTTIAGAGAGSTVTRVYPLAGFGIASSTAEGGAGAADSASVIYTGTAVSSKAYTVLGYATWETGLATAGTWSATSTRTQPAFAGMALPSQPIQIVRKDDGAVATGTTTIPYDDTIPQNPSEGDMYLSAAPLTPNSAANILRITAKTILTTSVNAQQMLACLHKVGTSNAYFVSTETNQISNVSYELGVFGRILATETSAQAFIVRGGSPSAVTITFNGNGGSRQLGGVFNSFLEIEEQMG